MYEKTSNHVNVQRKNIMYNFKESNLGDDFYGTVELALTDDGNATKDIQILRIGKFEHPVYGTVNITKEDLIKFKESFEKKVRKIELAINYDHNKTVAAGWIKNVTLQNDGQELWATPEWTEEGFNNVKSRKYRYFSAELSWNYNDPETKKVYERVLLGGALTNYPFIKGMQAVEATEPKTKEEKKMDLNEIKVELKEKGIDLDALQAKEKEVVSLSEEIIKSKANNAKLENDVKELSEKLTKFEEAAKKAEFDNLVKKGMEEGKLTKDFSETIFNEIYEKNGKEFAEKMLSTMPKIVSTENAGHDQNKKEGNGDAAVELAEKARKLSEEKKISISEAINVVMSENKELANKYRDLGKE